MNKGQLTDTGDTRKINLFSQYLAFQKFAKEHKLKANVQAVYHALLCLANESYWNKEFEVRLQDALDQSQVDKDVYSKCLTTLYNLGLIETWQKGSNRHTKSKFTLKVLYQVDSEKSVSAQILPSDLSEQVDSEKSEHLINNNNNTLKKEHLNNKDRSFTPPSSVIVVDFFEQNFNNKGEADKFFDYYVSNDWKVGKNKMKNWQAAARNWMRRSADYKKEKNSGQKEKANKFRNRTEESRDSLKQLQDQSLAFLKANSKW